MTNQSVLSTSKTQYFPDKILAYAVLIICNKCIVVPPSHISNLLLTPIFLKKSTHFKSTAFFENSVVLYPRIVHATLSLIKMTKCVWRKKFLKAPICRCAWLKNGPIVLWEKGFYILFYNFNIISPR